jgi:putative restriction endonuclease
MLPLRSRSVENDVLVMQRQLDALEKYRFSLVKQGTPEYAELLPLIAERRWGLVWPDKAPIAQQQITEAKAQLIKLALKPFQAVTEEIKRVTGTQARIARSTAFRSGVRFEYDTTCAVSGIGVRTPTGLVEVEAAHVVPLKSGGSDDIRNGMALTSTLHWAFDHGLFGIKPGERRVFVPKQVLKIESCAFLHEFVGKPIRESRSTDYRVHDDALAWHMEHLTQKWEH